MGIEPRITTVDGVPLTVNGRYGVMDAARIHAGYYGVTVADTLSKITTVKGFESSYLEHVVLERFVGSQGYSAVKLVQFVDPHEITTANESVIGTLDISEDLKDQIRIQVDQGRTVWAPQGMYDPSETGLPDLYGFIARDPSTGEALYAVNSMFGGASGTGGTGSGGTGCTSCGENGPGNSLVHLYSGNYTDSVTDLTLPAKGIPLVLTRTYNSQLGWTHNYLERLDDPQGEGQPLTYVDDHGIPWTFLWDGTTSEWTPPPKLFQRIKFVGGVYEMTFKDGLVHEFNTAGQMTLQRDLNDNWLGLTQVGGRLVEVSASSGAFFTFDYNASGHLTGVTDSASRSVSFLPDDAGRILTETDVLGQTRHYTYDAVTGWMRTKTAFRDDTIVWRMDYDDHGRLVRAEDPDGNARTYAYDFAARKVLYTDRDGASTLYELNDLAKPIRVVDALGNEKALEYDASGNKTAEYDARGGDPTLFQNYDAKGNLGRRIDPTLAVTDYTYEGPYSRLKKTTVYHNSVGQDTTNTYSTDGHWNLVATEDALGKTTNYAYTGEGLVSTITRPGSAATGFAYHPDGSVWTITDPEDGVTTMTYDAAGHLDTITDASGNPRDLTIDVKGQLTAMADAMGQATSFDYDEDGNRTKVIAPDGDSNPTNNPTTTLVYDDASRLTQTIDALGHVTRQEYDAEGNVTARIDARGYRTTMRYDALGRLVESCDALGNCTTMGYCAELAGQACLTIDALGNVTEIEEDVLGRESARIDPLERRTETTYDDLGRRDSVTDSGSNVTAFDYDPLGRLTLLTDARNGVTEYGYDDRGNRTSVEDANHHTTLFEYDLANRLTKETTPIDTITEFTYYFDGSRETKLDGKDQLTTFSYNANRQLTHIDYHGESTADFEYDERGNKTLEQNADSTRNLFYDALGRLETVEDVDSGRTIDYVYDPVGNRTSMTVDDGPGGEDPETTKYVWDGRGLLTRLTDPEGGEYRFRYDALGRRTTTTYPNGMTLQTTYDAASQVLAMVYSHPARGVIQSFTYTYVDGNRTSKVFADATAEIYGYDELSRLTNVEYTTTGRQVTYVYDDVGNRQAMSEQNGSTTQTTEYQYNYFNQLESHTIDGTPATTTTFAYDLNGNQTDKIEPGTTATFTYDARDRMTQVATPTATSTFGYDTQNLRVYMNDSQGERRILLDGIEELAEYDTTAPNDRVARYDHDPSRVDALLAQSTSQENHYFVTDAIGSVYGLTDAVGLDRARYAYDVYGAKTASLEQVATRWGFTGRRLGTVDYYRQRYLDAALARFLSPDPARDGPNQYSYASLAPTLYTDPMGLAARRIALVMYGIFGPWQDSGDPSKWYMDNRFTGESWNLAVGRAVTGYVSSGLPIVVERAGSLHWMRALAMLYATDEVVEFVYLGHMTTCGENNVNCLDVASGITPDAMAGILRDLGEMQSATFLSCGEGAPADNFGQLVAEDLNGPGPRPKVVRAFLGTAGIRISVAGNHVTGIRFVRRPPLRSFPVRP